MTTAKPRRRATRPPEVDWKRIDAFTDEDIDRMIAEDPDVAPVLDWDLDDPKVEAIVPINVKVIRDALGLSQAEFAETFGLRVATVRDWEQQRRVPMGPALSLLRIIEREPEAARRALSRDKQRAPAAEGS
jgi:putative transcriptional regulator